MGVVLLMFLTLQPDSFAPKTRKAHARCGDPHMTFYRLRCPLVTLDRTVQEGEFIDVFLLPFAGLYSALMVSASLSVQHGVTETRAALKLFIWTVGSADVAASAWHNASPGAGADPALLLAGPARG